MIKTANQAIAKIGHDLGLEAMRDDVSPQELQDFVREASKDLSAEERQVLVRSFETQSKRIGESYFASVFGVSKEELKQALLEHSSRNPAPQGLESLQEGTLDKAKYISIISQPYPLVEEKLARLLADEPAIQSRLTDPADFQKLARQLLVYGPKTLEERLEEFLLSTPPRQQPTLKALETTLDRLEELSMIEIPYPLVEERFIETLSQDPAVRTRANTTAALRSLAIKLLLPSHLSIEKRLQDFLSS